MGSDLGQWITGSVVKCFSMNEVDSFYFKLLEWERGVGRGVGAIGPAWTLVDFAPIAQTLRFTMFWSPACRISDTKKYVFREIRTFSFYKSVSGIAFYEVSSISGHFLYC